MKTFYHKTTGNAAVFADDANIADWPVYSETLVVDSDALAIEIRAERDALLLASDADWSYCTSLSFTMTHAAWQANQHCIDWATYRQALRDVTSQAGFPETIVWPTKPGENF